MNCESGEKSPPQLRRGGCAIKKMSRSDRDSRRRGGVVQVQSNSLDQHHPGRSNKVASHFLLDVASTPPQLRRGLFARSASHSHLLDRAFSSIPKHWETPFIHYHVRKL